MDSFTAARSQMGKSLAFLSRSARTDGRQQRVTVKHSFVPGHRCRYRRRTSDPIADRAVARLQTHRKSRSAGADTTLV